MRTPKQTRDAAVSVTRRDALAARRAAAIKLLESDLSLAEIARRVGVSRESVRLWRDALGSGGPAQLVAPSSKRQGRPPKLSQRSEQRLIAMLMRPASRYGFAADEWSTARVFAVLELKFNVTYSSRGLEQMLGRYGFCFVPDDGWRPCLKAVGGRASRSTSMGFAAKKTGRITWSAADRARVVALHMQLSGFSLPAITSLLREAGVVDHAGKPIREAAVRQLLRQQDARSGHVRVQIVAPHARDRARPDIHVRLHAARHREERRD